MAIGRKTGGRRPGTPNRVTAAKRDQILASGMSPLDYLVSVFRDEDQPVNVRLDAARSAANFVHPRISMLGIGRLEDRSLQVRIVRFGDPPIPK